jgi:outer membrane protein assembly factor BamD
VNFPALSGARRSFPARRSGGTSVRNALRSFVHHALATAAAVTLLSGCALFGSKGDSDVRSSWTVEKLYADAEDEQSAGGWGNAIKDLEQIQSRFPFGRYAQQAQMELAYCQYRDGEKELALSAVDRFIRQYPNSPNIDYVYYLKGLINFNDNLGILGKFAGQDLTERDPKALRDSFDAFRDVAIRFPESKYTPDSIIRLKYLVNAMAAHEIHVARYYLRRGAYVAAANRAEGVIQQYQQAPATHDALEVMVASYAALNMPQLRDDAQRILDTNFPPGTFNVVQDKKAWWNFWSSTPPVEDTEVVKVKKAWWQFW